MARGLSTRSRFAMAYLVLGAAVGIADRRLHRPASSAPARRRRRRGRAGAAPRRPPFFARSRDRHARRQRLPAPERPPAEPDQGRRPGPAEEHRARDRHQQTVQAKSLDDFDLVRPEQERDVRALRARGKSCKISEGKASVARGTVLRREALELALYTLK